MKLRLRSFLFLYRRVISLPMNEETAFLSSNLGGNAEKFVPGNLLIAGDFLFWEDIWNEHFRRFEMARCNQSGNGS